MVWDLQTTSQLINLMDGQMETTIFPLPSTIQEVIQYHKILLMDAAEILNKRASV